MLLGEWLRNDIHTTTTTTTNKIRHDAWNGWPADIIQITLSHSNHHYIDGRVNGQQQQQHLTALDTQTKTDWTFILAIKILHKLHHPKTETKQENKQTKHTHTPRNHTHMGSTFIR